MDFERLAARHKDAVYRQMVRVCGNHDDAEDALAEALMAAYRHAGQLRDESAFRGWLAIIGRRVCGKLKRSEAVRPIIELTNELAQSGTPFDDIAMKALKNRVMDAIGRLPPSLREVYRLRELEGVPANEVAGKLGLTLANVKTRLHRARVKVRTFLDEAVCG